MTRSSAGGPSLGIVTEMSVYRDERGLLMHVAIGRIVEKLAARYAKVYLSAPVADAPERGSGDHRLSAPNIEVIPQPYYATSLGAIRHALGIVRAYVQVCRRAGDIFVRGMIPYVAFFYLAAIVWRRRPCHWIVGDPVALLRTHRRASWLADTLALAYAWQDRLFSRLGRRLTGGAFLANGQALGQAYRSPRTVVAASGTITEDEFFERADTCAGPAVTILFVGYIRPEKGVEYLLEAVGRLQAPKPWRLVLVGPWEQFADYRARLDAAVARLGIGDRLRWDGYLAYGEPVLSRMRGADLLVLPSLSEGTPHVLVEARASGLPVIATAVGGIPTAVTDGVDGILVPPKDAQALADAMARVMTDGDLRRSLIRHGYVSARAQTVDRFVDHVASLLEGPGRGEG